MPERGLEEYQEPITEFQVLPFLSRQPVSPPPPRVVLCVSGTDLIFHSVLKGQTFLRVRSVCSLA